MSLSAELEYVKKIVENVLVKPREKFIPA